MLRVLFAACLLVVGLSSTVQAANHQADLPAVFGQNGQKNLDCYTALLALRRVGAYDMQRSGTAKRLTVGGLAYDAGENMLVVVQKTENGGEIVALVECK